MRLSLVFLTTVFSLSQAAWVEPEFENITTADLDTVHSRIIGGSSVTIERFPYLVQIERNRALSCGGALLTRRHVLSAAHCFYDNNGAFISASQFQVRVGATRRGRDGSTFRISTIVIHHAYNLRTQDADIAVLVLSSRVSTGSRVGIARVPVQGQTFNYNIPLIYAGWGHTIAGVDSLPTNLQAVSVQKVNYTVCAERYRNAPAVLGGPVYLTTNMMCAGLLDIGGADACQGDSGGPLLLDDVVVGVVSFGIGCGQPQYPGVNARVSAFSNWISNTVVQFNGSAAPLGSAVLLITCILASLALMVKEV